jgi:hypothetical protein
MRLRKMPPILRLSAASSLGLTLSLAGCGGGGGDAAGPGEPFPNVSGSYNIEGGFDGLTRNEASFVGSLSLSQASRQSGTLTGTMSVTLTIDGDVTTAGDVRLQSASVTPNGTVSFQLGTISTGGSWTFSGTAAGETISGRHTLTDGSNVFSGNWTASIGSVGAGSLTVTASTTGTNVDPDGYTLTVDGAGRGTLGNNGVTITGLAQGNHAVGLSGVAANCQVQGENPRLVTISPGATASVSFSVVCTTPPAGAGSIQVTTTTSGADPDPDGYVATLDGIQPGLSVPAAGAATFPNVSVGNHSVALTGLASNCTVAGGLSKSVTVTAGVTATVDFSITCSALPPTTGSIRITTTTTGSDLDPNGYQFAIDGGTSQTIGLNSTQGVSDITEGSHTVVLSDVESNCSVVGGPSRNVSVLAGQTSDLAFSVTCTSTRPSASRSSLLADPKSIPTGGSSTIIVTVRDVSGQPVASTTVTLSSSGTGNSLSPASATTDESGVATFSFSSTVAEDKTITATADGVTLDDTEVISVFRRSSTIQITGDQNDPSAPGEEITVTFTVAVEGGGTPTGTVTIFSLEEAGVGCTVDVSAGSCTFALNTPGLHHLQATYSGDSQFEDSSDPDGEEHLVATESAARSGRLHR